MDKILKLGEIQNTSDAVELAAQQLVSDIQKGQYLINMAKIKVLEEIASRAKELIKEEARKEFDLHQNNKVVIGNVTFTLKSRQDNDFTTNAAFNRAQGEVDRIKEKMKSCKETYYDSELNCQIDPPGKKVPIVYLEVKLP